MKALFCRLALVACTAWGCEWAPNLPREPSSALPAPVRIPDPIGPAGENESADILQLYADRPMIAELEPRTWELPFQSKRLGVALLIITARDRVEDLDLVLTDDARWGLPDRRQFGAQPVFGRDGGEAFLQGFRSALRRVPSTATWKSSPMPPGVQETVRTGSEPAWISFGEGVDSVVIREVMRDGAAQIDYVGFFVEPPEGSVRVAGRPAIPPTVPPPRRAEELADTDAAALAQPDETAPDGE